MLPFLVAAGIGLTAAGAATSFFGASAANDAQKDMIELERKAEGERRRAMELDSRRKILEVMRNSQRARALALTVATSQGAGQGSGLMGAYGQISGQTGDNFLGVTQNREIGRNLFDINAQLGDAKIAMADAQTTMSMGAGLSSLGGSFMGSLGAMKGLSGGYNPTPTEPFTMNSYGGQIRGMGSNGIY